MRKTWLSIIAIVALMGATSALAQLQPGDPGYVADDEKDKGPAKVPFPLHINASTTQTLGTGTFVAGFADNPLFATNVNLNPWAMWKGWLFSVNQNIDIEWTQSDLTTYPNQVILSDLRFGAMYPGLRFNEIGVGTIFQFALDAPLSLQSRQAGQVTALTTRAGANWTWAPAKLTLAAVVGARGNLIVPSLARGFADNPVKPFIDDAGNEITPTGACITRDASELQNFGCGIMPNGLVLSGGVNANWIFGEGWSMNGGLTVAQLYSIYNAPDDALTSPNARAGFGTMEFLIGFVGVNWMPEPWFILSGSISHFDDLRVATRDNLRLPFIDSLILNPARNGTTFNLTTTFQY